MNWMYFINCKTSIICKNKTGFKNKRGRDDIPIALVAPEPAARASTLPACFNFMQLSFYNSFSWYKLLIHRQVF